MTEASGRSVLILGASGGIGRATAEALSSDGFRVALHASSHPERAEALAEELRSKGADAWTVVFDAADPAASRSAIEADIEHHGAYWGIVHSAGITQGFRTLLNELRSVLMTSNQSLSVIPGNAASRVMPAECTIPQ